VVASLGEFEATNGTSRDEHDPNTFPSEAWPSIKDQKIATITI
jgi:hypothetical protein